MKKLLALLLAAVMVLALVACTPVDNDKDVDDGLIHVKAGLVCIGDGNDSYTANFIKATVTAKAALLEKGIDVEWIFKYNLPVEVQDANEELAEDGCIIVYNNSYDQEPKMKEAAKNYPDTQFVSISNQGSWGDDLANTHNAFARIYEARYLAGIVAGMKLQSMIDAEEITADEAVIGYVGAFPFAEVVSGYTAYYLGARSVCPTVTMKVQYVSSWSDATAEGNAAQALIDAGAVLISQHSDNTTPATVAQQNGKFHTGYNADMISAAPQASLVSARIDWTKYYVYSIETLVNGGTVDQDYAHGLATGEVTLTDYNTSLLAEGTVEAVEAAKAAIIDGTLKIYDITKFTVDGKQVTQAFALDTDGDWTPDSVEAIVDGAFVESYVLDGNTAGTVQSSPYFALRIDGITELN